MAMTREMRQLRRRIAELEEYLDGHPDASSVSDELNEAMAELEDLELPPPCERHPLDYISCVDEYGAQTCAWCGADKLTRCQWGKATDA